MTKGWTTYQKLIDEEKRKAAGLPDPWEAGYDAFADDPSNKQNPYKENTSEYKLWENGWRDARTDGSWTEWEY